MHLTPNKQKIGPVLANMNMDMMYLDKCYRMVPRRTRLVLSGFLVFLSCLTTGRASSLTLDYDVGGQPALEAVLSDTAGGVTLSLSALGSADGINSIYFNLNPLLSSSSLAFTAAGASGGTFSDFTVQTGTDCFKVDGGGKYDIKLSFLNTAISSGDSITFDIAGITGLNAGDFNYLSTPGVGSNGPSISSAILTASGGVPIVVLDQSNYQSNDSTVPDSFPTAALLGLSFAGLEVLRRTRRAALANAS